MNSKWFADDSLNGEAGIQRGVWILEYDLCLGTKLTHVRAAQIDDVLAGEQYPATRGLNQSQHTPRNSRFAGTRLAHEPERFAWQYPQTHVLDSAYVSACAAEEACSNREALLESDHLEK